MLIELAKKRVPQIVMLLIPALNGRKLTVYAVRNLPKTLTERKGELSICSP